MPATAARIGFITQEMRTVTAGPDTEVVAKYGKLARDTKETVETLFDSIADVQAVCDERLALLKADRRRFQQVISGEIFATSLSYEATMPVVNVIDTERNANLTAVVVELAADFEASRSAVTTWG